MSTKRTVIGSALIALLSYCFCIDSSAKLSDENIEQEVGKRITVAGRWTDLRKLGCYITPSDSNIRIYVEVNPPHPTGKQRKASFINESDEVLKYYRASVNRLNILCRDFRDGESVKITGTLQKHVNNNFGHLYYFIVDYSTFEHLRK